MKPKMKYTEQSYQQLLQKLLVMLRLGPRWSFKTYICSYASPALFKVWTFTWTEWLFI